MKILDLRFSCVFLVLISVVMGWSFYEDSTPWLDIILLSVYVLLQLKLPSVTNADVCCERAGRLLWRIIGWVGLAVCLYYIYTDRLYCPSDMLLVVTSSIYDLVNFCSETKFVFSVVTVAVFMAAVYGIAPAVLRGRTIRPTL